MNKTTKWLTTLVAVLVIVNIILVASIWVKKEDVSKPPPFRGDARDYLIETLSLNEAQVKSFDSLRKDHFLRIAQYQNEAHISKDKIFSTISSPEDDSVKMKIRDTVAKRIGEIQAAIDKETSDHFSQLRKLLTAQQQQKFDSTIQQVLRTMAPGGPRPPRPGEGRESPGDRMGPPPGRGPGGPPPPEGERPPHS